MKSVIEKIWKNYHPDLLTEVAGLPIKLAKLEFYAKRNILPEKFHFGNHPRQYAVFQTPPEGVPRRDTVIMFYHGGGWRLGYPGMFPAVPEFFLRLGFPVVMPSYRKTPRFSYLDMRQDLNLAWHATQDYLKTKNISGERILVGGMSAGANLAAHLVFDRVEQRRSGLDKKRMVGFISCGGPLELNAMADTFPLAQFTGGKFGSPEFQRANPMTHLLEKEEVASFFVHGTADRIVPFDASKTFFEKLKLTAPAEFVSLPGKKHIDSLGWAADDFLTAASFKKWLERF